MYKVDTALAIRLGLARNQRSQSWLAREIGKRRSYVSELCSDNNPARPSLGCLEDISKALQIPIYVLIKEGCEA